MSRVGLPGAEKRVVRLRCRPASIPRSRAIAAARSESSMKTIALTEETVPRRAHSKICPVVLWSRPQSSALTMSTPGEVQLPLWGGRLSDGARPSEDHGVGSQGKEIAPHVGL